MHTVNFDTLKFVERLIASGMPEDQAKALSQALADAHTETPVITGKDLQIELAPIRSDLQVMKWMISVVLGGIVALILKTFF